MKITNIRVKRYRKQFDPPFNAAWDPVPRAHLDSTIVWVDTDEGITGYGSGDVCDGIEKFIDFFIGEDPMQILRHVQRIETMNYHSARYWPLEAALWDIIGKVTGQPLYKLLGGSTDRLLAYASSGEIISPEERVEKTLQMREEGYKALKIRIHNHRMDLGIKTVQAVREAVGDTMDIMVDFNQAWRMMGDITPTADPRQAQILADALSELGVFWLEEPLSEYDIKGLADLRAKSRIRIAGCEGTRSLNELLKFVDADALDVYQPDVVYTIGILRSQMLAQLVMYKNRFYTPHTWGTGIGLLINAHVTAGVGGGPYLEFPYDPPNFSLERRDYMYSEPITIDEDGYVVLPDAPGLGIDLDMEKLDPIEIHY